MGFVISESLLALFYGVETALSDLCLIFFIYVNFWKGINYLSCDVYGSGKGSVRGNVKRSGADADFVFWFLCLYRLFVS